jgi:hypothetical protein
MVVTSQKLTRMVFMRFWFLLGVALLWVSPHALAVLGGSASNIARDGTITSSSAAALAALSGANSNRGVILQTIITVEGVTVNEFVAQDHIFAVSWGGQVMPDLSLLLGPNFPAFQQAVQNRPRLGRNAPLVVETQDLVVHSYGHMRAFKGVAYIPSLVPPGFDITRIEP